LRNTPPSSGWSAPPRPYPTTSLRSPKASNISGRLYSSTDGQPPHRAPRYARDVAR
jgi:hypothetical protein